MIQAIEARSARRVISAKASPTRRAEFCRPGKRPERIAMRSFRAAAPQMVTPPFMSVKPRPPVEGIDRVHITAPEQLSQHAVEAQAGPVTEL